jgi:acetyltransferase-like isoleucine patch superfamily enzyme
MLRKVLICSIAIIPFNNLRILLYRLLLGYKIDWSCKIGIFNYLDCTYAKLSESSSIGIFNYIHTEKLTMQNSGIGRLNKIKFLKSLKMEPKSVIRSRNVILGTAGFFSPYSDVFNFEIGENSLITSNHYFDCTANIKIGKNVVFGGINSQVWTHGFDKNRAMILGSVKIQDDIYIGSNVIILQNVRIVSDVSIGAGCVVSKDIFEAGFYVSSSLVRKGDVVDYSKNVNTVIYEGARFYKRE